MSLAAIDVRRTEVKKMELPIEQNRSRRDRSGVSWLKLRSDLSGLMF